MRPTLVIVLAAVGSALAAWLLPASVHIVAWDASGARRVAVFPPIWQLASSAVVALTAACALWWAPEGRQARALAVAPLLVLWLCVLPYLPGLPDRLPLLLVLAGPVKWWVVAFAITVAAARRSGASSRLPQWAARVGRRTVFVVSFVVYLAFGLRSLGTIGLKGDEPHYLIISQSLLADADLSIENNHRRREYRAFTREELPPDYLRRGQNGEIYSVHAPGLPALLVPAYAAAGARGALAAMCAAGALAALAVFELAALIAGPGAALLTWASVALTVPVVPYAWSVFPEVPGAAIAAWGAVWLVSLREASRPAWLGRGVALALLPWLHTKLVVLEAALGALLAWRLRRDRAAALALLLPIAVSGLAWFAYFSVVYGTPNPEAPYGSFARDWVKLEFVPRGVLGLLFDQKFGLVPYAPVYLLAPIGLWISVRSRQACWLRLGLAAVAAAFVVSSARLYMWWGGWSAPARFLVPVLPLLVPAVALALDRLRSTKAAWVVPLLVFTSLATSLAGAAVPERMLLFSEAHGVSRLAATIQGSAPLTATLPMFTESTWQPRDLIPRAYTPADRLASVVRGRIDLLDRSHPSRRAFDYTAMRVLQLHEWRATGTLTDAITPASGSPPLPPEGVFAEGPSFWTMGTERGRVLVAPAGHRALDVTVHIGPAGGRCRTSVNGETRADPMQAYETHVLSFDDIPADAAWVAVSVQASQPFRPADADPTSRDQRLLGCQVTVALR